MSRTIGVYCITCIPTGKFYIGSSVCIEQRFHGHRKLLVAGRHHSRDMQRAWNIHGEDAFEFEIIDTQTSEVGLRQRERELIVQSDAVRKGFNRTYETEFRKPDRVLKFNEKGKLLNRSLRRHEKKRILQIGQKAFVEEMELTGVRVKRKRVKTCKKWRVANSKPTNSGAVWSTQEPHIIRK